MVHFGSVKPQVTDRIEIFCVFNATFLNAIDVSHILKPWMYQHAQLYSRSLLLELQQLTAARQAEFTGNLRIIVAITVGCTTATSPTWPSTNHQALQDQNLSLLLS